MGEETSTEAGGGVRLPVARSVSGFQLAPGEEVALELAPTRTDALVIGAGTGGLLWLMTLVHFVTDVGTSDPMSPGQFGAVTAVMAAVGFLVALFATAHRTRLVATDRGLHIRRSDGRDAEFVPWLDVLSIESAMPFTAVWRITLRDDAPEVSSTGWSQRWYLSGTGDGNVCVVGDESLYDFRGARLDVLQEAHDRWLEENLVKGDDAGEGAGGEDGETPV